MECPCLSQKNYEDCCGPIHSGEKAVQTAEELMRSRYSAFVKQEIDFIIESNKDLVLYLKYFGALYLFYLAYDELRAKDKLVQKNTNNSLFLRGLYMNLINPKVLFFFIAYFPNFLFSETISISLQFLILGSIFIAQALFIFCTVSVVSNKMMTLLKLDTQSNMITYLKSFVFLIIGLLILL